MTQNGRDIEAGRREVEVVVPVPPFARNNKRDVDDDDGYSFIGGSDDDNKDDDAVTRESSASDATKGTKRKSVTFGTTAAIKTDEVSGDKRIRFAAAGGGTSSNSNARSLPFGRSGEEDGSSRSCHNNDDRCIASLSVPERERYSVEKSLRRMETGGTVEDDEDETDAKDDDNCDNKKKSKILKYRNERYDYYDFSTGTEGREQIRLIMAMSASLCTVLICALLYTVGGY